MVGVKLLLASVMIMAVTFGGRSAAAQVHHVVGGDRGWDSALDVASWSAGRVFRVGDNIWFAYSAAQESIAELRSKEEYESCDVRNPIRMYTDGLDVIPLEGEGIRYFVSSKNDNCKNGLKLHVDVKPHQSSETTAESTASKGSVFPLATAPAAPSDSTRLGASLILAFAGVGLLMGF